MSSPHRAGKKMEHQNKPYTLIKNIIYHRATEFHHKHRLDIYLPLSTKPQDKKPVIFFVHGGGWKRGDKDWTFGRYENVGAALTKQDFICVIISYRLSAVSLIELSALFIFISILVGLFFSSFISFVYDGLQILVTNVLPDYPHSSVWILTTLLIFGILFVQFLQKEYVFRPFVKHPEHLYDVAYAYSWVRKNIQDLGGDPDNIFLSGHSAGGHLITLLALDSRYLRRAIPDADSSTLKGVISISGVFDLQRLLNVPLAGRWYVVPAFGTDVETLKEASPLTHVRKVETKFLFINAWIDLHLGDDAKTLTEALNQVGDEASHVVLTSLNHATILARINSKYDLVTPLIVDFVNKHRSLAKKSEEGF
eukprot:TRINITY_DN15490_c0_g1_i1.p1 TRINITY_DN15490_c0_g1~~TRINITY_DN15490_c0_g1_i1.p1  ORF type:complete len:366 (-),score=61.94 TRINITY_DN15490_c0_g1_i1:158-1255(-)